MSKSTESDTITKMRSVLADYASNDIPEADNSLLRSDLMHDLGCDSLDMISLLFALEGEFKVQIPETAIEEEGLATVQDFVTYIAAQKSS